jgi:hypothetical protein
MAVKMVELWVDLSVLMLAEMKVETKEFVLDVT